MKVSTDACILGAWAPIPDHAKHVLDIGAGTGLLSLMLAQRDNTIHIDAAELDADACSQAIENVQSSPWADRIDMHEGDVNTIIFDRKYDIIICNPPFFNNSLLGPSDNRNTARHTITLSYEQLYTAVERNLTEEGQVSILFPYTEAKQFEELLLTQHWCVNRKLYIHPRTGAEPNRTIIVCSRMKGEMEHEHLYIRDEANEYTSEFKELMSPYYLAL
jgi:tRNA1Val (adenine37-N6)-methyltransferase